MKVELREKIFCQEYVKELDVTDWLTIAEQQITMKLKKRCFLQLISDSTTPQVLIVLTAFHNHPLSYMFYEFPLLSHSLGLVISVLPIVPVPVYAVWSVWKKEGSITNVSLRVQCSHKLEYLSNIKIPEQI